jgi:hypothetical protein
MIGRQWAAARHTRAREHTHNNTHAPAHTHTHTHTHSHTQVKAQMKAAKGPGDYQRLNIQQQVWGWGA